MAAKRICAVESCDKPVKKGERYCYGHYARWHNHGDPLAGRSPTGAGVKFLREIAFRYSGDDCLDWPYGLMPAGYGSIKWNGRSAAAHRVVCVEVHGDPPQQGLQAAHKCGNPRCCNPRHLRWATPKDNTHDKYAHGTMLSGEAHPWTKLTDSQVIEIASMKGRKPTKLLASDYGVSPDLVRMIFKGHRQHHERSP